ncbi:transcriptional regulator, HxlR family [Flagellimonas taeanensis]|jgi:DNA-binding HxlR family transcriptional regulator|uniref:Transcriptional regulator, HxlR family n=1 Tax=Flagellimonas taeanensis TaxID=1005926 RepID=A0A1M6UXL5_9FLAO|nr:winged helix-turn-helix transcriptional regulator [Allomuricauda taeanensis]MEE1963144.1 winged helix-turn-helix transcriptional regulator [Allomuricauda taeanensis]SFC22635.1 transcriptional regulator, HxlR family [Allomuricauda taeanensis]SHK73796.1 transcriptional regulator, HxlR family [Allomuricauda taeanensis]
MENKISKEACQRKLNGIDDALYAIGGKWKLKIILAVKEGNSRFNEIQRTIGISARMLSLELKELELNGFINRNVDTGPPVQVEYFTSPYCDTLEGVLVALSDWGEMHREKIRLDRS